MANATYFSHVKPTWEVMKESWVLSLLNTGDKTGGHAKIVAEGIEADGELYVGRYDITAIAVVNGLSERLQAFIGNVPGFINQVKVVESNNYDFEGPCYIDHKTGVVERELPPHQHRKFVDCTSTSWTRPPEAVKKMIEAIKDYSRELEALRADGYGIPYQAAGSERSSFLGGNGGESCVTFAEKMLAIADAGKGVLAKDKIKAVPELHARDEGWCSIL